MQDIATSSTRQLLEANLERVAANTPDMMATFYGLLFERYPAAKPLFGRNSQAEQQKMLGDTLMLLVANLDDPDFVQEKAAAIGRKHVDYNVEDHMYPWVGECLLETLKRGSGDEWTPDVASAWSGVLMTISNIAIEAAKDERASRKSSS